MHVSMVFTALFYYFILTNTCIGGGVGELGITTEAV